MKKVSLLTASVVLFLMICCCGVTGLICSQGVGRLIDKRATEIAEMSTTPDVAVGKQAALTGTLTGNASITSDPDLPNIADYNVVAYEVQVYERRTSGSGSSRRTSYSWNTTRTVVNTLTLEVNGQTVTVYAADNISFNGDMHAFPTGGSFSQGDHRVRGFQEGDLVTIVAKHMEDGRFMADELYGGTRDELVSDTRTVAKIFRYIGYGMMAVAAVLTAVALIIGGFFLSRRRSQ
jgi:hypothetical protein